MKLDCFPILKRLTPEAQIVYARQRAEMWVTRKQQLAEAEATCRRQCQEVERTFDQGCAEIFDALYADPSNRAETSAPQEETP
jgi:hypothetical protein